MRKSLQVHLRVPLAVRQQWLDLCEGSSFETQSELFSFIVNMIHQYIVNKPTPAHNGN